MTYNNLPDLAALLEILRQFDTDGKAEAKIDAAVSFHDPENEEPYRHRSRASVESALVYKHRTIARELSQLISTLTILDIMSTEGGWEDWRASREEANEA